VVSDTAPTNTGAGTGWYNLEDGQTYIDIDDGDSTQWVPANPPQVIEAINLSSGGQVKANAISTGLNIVGTISNTSKIRHNTAAIRLNHLTGVANSGSLPSGWTCEKIGGSATTSYIRITHNLNLNTNLYSVTGLVLSTNQPYMLTWAPSTNYFDVYQWRVLDGAQRGDLSYNNSITVAW